MRVSLAVQDAAFVAGVVHMVSESLGLRADDQRRIAAAVIRRRLLGEPVPSLDDVDYAWQAWWPPPPGDEGRMLFAHFLGTWREWLASSTGMSAPEREQRLVFGEVAEQYDEARPVVSRRGVRHDRRVRRSSTRRPRARDRRGNGQGHDGIRRARSRRSRVGTDSGDGCAAAGQGRPRSSRGSSNRGSPPAQRFRLVYAAQSWHWVGGDDRYERAAAALEPGGTVAFFWNKGRDWAGPLEADNDAVYAKLAPHLSGGKQQWNLDWVADGLRRVRGVRSRRCSARSRGAGATRPPSGCSCSAPIPTTGSFPRNSARSSTPRSAT